MFVVKEEQRDIFWDLFGKSVLAINYDHTTAAMAESADSTSGKLALQKHISMAVFVISNTLAYPSKLYNNLQQR